MHPIRQAQNRPLVSVGRRRSYRHRSADHPIAQYGTSALGQVRENARRLQGTSNTAESQSSCRYRTGAGRSWRREYRHRTWADLRRVGRERGAILCAEEPVERVTLWVVSTLKRREPKGLVGRVLEVRSEACDVLGDRRDLY